MRTTLSRFPHTIYDVWDFYRCVAGAYLVFLPPKFVMTSNGNGVSHGHDSTLDQRIVPPMGMTGSQFQEAAIATVNDIEKYYSTLADRPVVPSIEPGYMQKLLPDEAPQQGEEWESIAKDIEGKIMPGVTHWQSPKFMAFFPANSTYPGILGEMWSAALTAPAFNWMCSPVVTELETVVLDWLAKILKLPEVFLSSNEGGGVIQGSASEAIATVMVAARERFVRRQLERENLSPSTSSEEELEDRACEIRSKLVALGSEQAHSSTKKAAIIAGTRYRSISAASTNSSNTFRTYFSSASGLADTTRIANTPPITVDVKKNSFFPSIISNTAFVASFAF